MTTDALARPERLDRMLRRAVRVAWSLTGLFWFAWIAYEDRDLAAVVLLAACVATASGLTVWRRWRSARRLQASVGLRGSVIGLLTGASVAPVALLLILVKTSLHSHPIPDFSAADLGQVLTVWPVWSAAGLLVGLAGAALERELAGPPNGTSIVGGPSVAYNRPTGGESAMAAFTEVQVYLCPRCLDSQAAPGVCPRCGLERLGCQPGAPDDPCRKPLLDVAGQVRTRAPLWWLRQTVGPLTRFLESGSERRS